MCGRINLLAAPAELAEFFELFREPEEWLPRYNLGPMQQILVIRRHPDGVRLAEPMQWGLVPRWSKSSSGAAQMINARSDTVIDKPAFREPIRHQRCLIPVSGYYEWQHINSKTKQAWHIHRSDGQMLALAGLWDHWNSPDGNPLESCSIITTDANEFIAEIHTRMPVLLPKDEWNMWLEPNDMDHGKLTELFRPTSSPELKKEAVSSFVNNIHHDSPECIRPVKPPLTLF